jgi:hypothetical protein
MDTLDHANGMTVEFKDPTDFREPEPERHKPAKLRLVRPAKKAASRELVDLKAMEADLMALCKEPITPGSVAREIHNTAVVQLRKIRDERQGIADRIELIVNRTNDVVGVYTERLADYDKAIDKIVNGIGPGTPPPEAA